LGHSVKLASFAAAAAVLVASLLPNATLLAQPTAPASVEDGKYLDKDGNPTYQVKPDGTVDWYTYSGFRRYHSECHVCHGPDGAGSTYAPAIYESMKRLDYQAFAEAVAQGRQNVGPSQQSVMPALGTNKNVMCYLDDIYVYLRARSDDAIPRGRPQKREDKPKSYSDAEQACMGG
jgi:methanol metabolism-related c-type cytochrome